MSGRRLVPLCLLAAISAACSPQAAPFRNPLDRLGMELERIGWIGYFAPCAHTVFEDGVETTQSFDAETCYRLDPPKRMRGIWLVAMEHSEFLAGEVRVPEVTAFFDDNCTWLEARWPEDYDRIPALPEGALAGSTSAYAVEMIGRRASYPGLYGYGGCRNLVVVKELISIRRIDPPRPPSRGEVDRAIARIVAENRRRDEALASRSALDRWVLPCPVFVCRAPPEQPLRPLPGE